MTQNNLISIVTMWNKDKNCPVKTYLSAMKNRQIIRQKTTGNRYRIGILMSRTQKLKGFAAASLRLKTLNDNPYGNSSRDIGQMRNV